MDKLPINTVKEAVRPEPGGQGRDRKVDAEKLKKACTEFEALFTAEMLKFMRQAVPQGGLFGKGLGSEIYQSLMDQELSLKLSRSKGLGLGATMYRQMMKREKTPPLPERPVWNPLAQKVEDPEKK